MYVRCVFFKTVTLANLYVEIWIYILPKTYGYIDLKHCISGSPDDNSTNNYSISAYGEVFITGRGFDRESQPFVLLTVTAEDEGGKDTSTLINITVLDQNDNDPKFLTGFQFEVYQVTFERDKERVREREHC